MKSFLFFILMSFCTASVAATDYYQLNSPEQYQRFDQLSQELRCLVCQNQNLAESNAFLAEDLRQLIAKMIREGQSDEEIKSYLVSRYGEFILYRPKISPLTYLLWGGPFLFLIAGLTIVFMRKLSWK